MVNAFQKTGNKIKSSRDYLKKPLKRSNVKTIIASVECGVEQSKQTILQQATQEFAM